MIPSGFKAVTLDYDRTTLEFTGDDADRFSELVDMKGSYEFLLVLIPALSASAIVSIYVQQDEKIATIPKILHALDDDATGSFAHSTSSGAGSIAVIFRIGGAQHFRIHCSENQTANRVFYVQGFNRASGIGGIG